MKRAGHINSTLASAAKLLLVAMALLVHSSLFAQTERGCYTVGGSADISMQYQNTTSVFNMAMSPSFGVFVVKGFDIGGRYSIGIGSTRTYDAKNLVYNTTTTFTTQIGPNLKYYLGKTALKGVTSFNASYVVFTSIHKTSVTNYNGFIVGGTLGAAYFFNPHISLETVAYITASGYEKQLPTTRVGFSVGLFAFLDKKKRE